MKATNAEVVMRSGLTSKNPKNQELSCKLGGAMWRRSVCVQCVAQLIFSLPAWAGKHLAESTPHAILYNHQKPAHALILLPLLVPITMLQKWILHILIHWNTYWHQFTERKGSVSSKGARNNSNLQNFHIHNCIGIQNHWNMSLTAELNENFTILFTLSVKMRLKKVHE